MTLAITVVCAHNEEQRLPASLHAILAQTRLPDELLVINNASTDETGAVARQIPDVRVVDEARKAWLHSWKTLLWCEKSWPAAKRALRRNVDIALTLFRNGAWTVP